MALQQETMREGRVQESHRSGLIDRLIDGSASFAVPSYDAPFRGSCGACSLADKGNAAKREALSKAASILEKDGKNQEAATLRALIAQRYAA